MQEGKYAYTGENKKNTSIATISNSEDSPFLAFGLWLKERL